MTGAINVCYRGFHSCENLANCLLYYPIDVNIRYARVQIGGTVDIDGQVTASSEITIVELLTYEEIYSIIGLQTVVNNDIIRVLIGDRRLYHKLNNTTIGHIYCIDDLTTQICLYYDNDGNLHSDFTDKDVRQGKNATTESCGRYAQKAWYHQGVYYASESDKYVIWHTRDTRECTLCGDQIVSFTNTWYNTRCCRKPLIGPIIKRARLMLNRR
jgi:hypothetical protein